MKFTKLLVVAGLAACLGACETVRNEAGYPGGNVGRLADKNFYVARSYEQRIDRYILGLAFIAPLSAATAQTPEDAASSARYITSVYKQLVLLQNTLDECPDLLDHYAPKPAEDEKPVAPLNVLTAFLTGGDGGSEQAQTEPTPAAPLSATPALTSKCTTEDLSEANIFAFESYEFRVQRSLFHLTQQAADNLNLKANVSSLAGLDAFQLLQLVLKTRKLIPVLMRYMATYRDLSVIFSTAVTTGCKEDAPAKCETLRGYISNQFHNSGTIDFDAETQYRPIAAAFTEARKLADDPDVEWRLDKYHVAALVYHIDLACRELKLRQEIYDDLVSGDDCGKKTESERQKFVNKFMN